MTAPKTRRLAALLAALPLVAVPAARAARSGTIEAGSPRQLAHELLADYSRGRIDLDDLRARSLSASSRTAAPSSALSVASKAQPVGSWYCTVTGEGDEVLFTAYQSFHLGGTFTETSSLLGSLVEGPASGRWQPAGVNTYGLTFELFDFDDATGEAIGRVRVRVAFYLTSSTHLEAWSAVDILPLDTDEAFTVAEGPYSCNRMALRLP